jgi:hypothetical protein
MAKSKKPSKPRDPLFFYGEDEFAYELDLIKEYNTFDNQYTIILYRIDSVGTVQTGGRLHVGESRSREKKFLAPVELTARTTAGKASFKYIAGTSVTKQEYESFSFNVFLSDLEERQIELRTGDYVLWNDGEKDRFFEVSKSTTLNSTNGGRGFRPIYKEVFAVLKGDGSIPLTLTGRL